MDGHKLLAEIYEQQFTRKLEMDQRITTRRMIFRLKLDKHAAVATLLDGRQMYLGKATSVQEALRKIRATLRTTGGLQDMELSVFFYSYQLKRRAAAGLTSLSVASQQGLLDAMQLRRAVRARYYADLGVQPYRNWNPDGFLLASRRWDAAKQEK